MLPYGGDWRSTKLKLICWELTVASIATPTQKPSPLLAVIRIVLGTGLLNNKRLALRQRFGRQDLKLILL